MAQGTFTAHSNPPEMDNCAFSPATFINSFTVSYVPIIFLLTPQHCWILDYDWVEGIDLISIPAADFP